jgi:hypothetical protein
MIEYHSHALFTPEQVERILDAHEKKLLVPLGTLAREFKATGQGSLTQIAYQEPDPLFAFAKNFLADHWFDDNYSVDLSREVFYNKLVEAGFIERKTEDGTNTGTSGNP